MRAVPVYTHVTDVTYRRHCERVPLEEGSPRGVDEDVLANLTSEERSLHLDLKHFGRMFHNLTM